MHHHLDQDHHHHHQRHCARHQGHRQGGHGRGRGGRRGGGGFRIGRMIGDGDLNLIVLALLADEPRHGYDIIKALEEHSSGIYSPSPGIVYPTLTFVEEAGYASAASQGNRRTYTITPAGRTHLDENRERVDTVLAEIERVGRKMAKARDWIEGEGRQEDRGSPGDRDIAGVVPEVNEARRALKAAIAERLDDSPEEQRRVAAILREAAAAIRKPLAPGDAGDIDL